MSTEKERLDERILLFEFLKRQFKRVREDLVKMCKECVERGSDTCIAGERNHCEVRQCYIELTQLLNDEG